ncbi:hypothetical protein SAMN04490357_4498 [Streptomyces misionensis]|uniref:Uncharacterized protein n=1 Tax=Streptomyces misionensis TaxID=67331 RepID=A0A1H4ZST0_9ACTN|nr:hypothetical protein [Streptomyces misionensis]SED32390.1 hypothetical protein SAMN04490357_4498 [Streptomyces misionensis]
MDLDEYQTTYLLYAPAKNPGGWNLDLSTFGEALEAAFAEVRYEARQGRQFRLSFWAMTEEGIEFTGYASNEGRDTVLLADNTADEAAVFIVWLRDAFLPAPDLIRFSSEPAVEKGIETDWRMPATGDRSRIAEELKHHLGVVGT